MNKLLVALLLAHSFYSQECCSDRDCAPVEDGLVTERPDGYHYKHYTFPYQDKRVKLSPDGRYHVCQNPYNVFCIYVPERIS